ncbi:MAG: quinone-dependent dihydroorotate dehydrogenase [Sphingobacteriaceae bacterium]|nr:quinone-dependent dihydroorotate dehydrogenase [Sphingobacteriaceae bacterium]
MYSFLKRILFLISPERVHHWVMAGLKATCSIGVFRNAIQSAFTLDNPKLVKEVFGLTFKNPVGLAAGFDKNAEFIEDLASFGFGFIEIGTVTPLPQPGNPKPRMFRLPADEGLINRMGFNNQGVDVVADRLSRVERNGLIIGGNIGKNKATPNEKAVDDYVICFDRLFDVVDYFVVNVSSPNTPGLRELQEKEPLKHILKTLQKRNNKAGLSKPILLKIAPDLSDAQLDDIVEIVLESKIAGLIATNTTLNREGLASAKTLTDEAGGLSGKPLSQRATEVIAYLHKKSNKAFPIIGVGGIHSAKDALEKLQAGASLVQVYTGFIYQGPGLIKAINKGIAQN